MWTFPRTAWPWSSEKETFRDTTWTFSKKMRTFPVSRWTFRDMEWTLRLVQGIFRVARCLFPPVPGTLPPWPTPGSVRRAADWRRIKHPVSWPGSLNPNAEVNHKERRERKEGQGFGQHSPWTISPAAPSGPMPSHCVLGDLCGYSISVFGLKTGSTKSFGQARFVSVKSERRQQRRTQFFRRHFRRPKTTPTRRRLRG